MKSTVRSLLTFAGCAAGFAGLASAADYTSPTYPGPYNVPVSAQFQSQDLNGAAIPATLYTRTTMQADWDRPVATLQWQNDSRASLTSAAVSGVTTIPGGVTIYYGGATGTIPSVATANNTPGTIRWNNQTLTTSYTGGNPLFFTFRTNYTGGSDVTWSNVIVTLQEPAVPPANQTCGTAQNISAALNAGLTAPGASVQTAAIDITSADATSFTQCNAASGARTVFYTFTPATTASYTVARGANDSVTAGEVFSITSGGCATPVSVICGATTVTTNLTAGITYQIQQSRTGTTALGGAENSFALVVTRNETATCGANTETEPNDNKAQANAFTLALNDTICGTTTGTSVGTGLTSYDYYKVTTAGSAGIKKNRLRVVSATSGHTLGLQGLNQTSPAAGSPGVAGTTDTNIQTSLTTTTPARYVQWYSLGNSAAADARSIYVRVGGTTTTTAQYSLNLIATDTITPIDASRNIVPGSIIFTTVGQTGATQTDTDVWLYDSSFSAIPLAGNDDTFPVPATNGLGSTLTRTLAAGTYYLSVGRFQTANNQVSPGDDNYRIGTLLDFPDVIATNSSTAASNATVKITDSTGDVSVPMTLNAFEVGFIKLVVGAAAPTRCQPADIADDAGNPLPSAGPNNGVNEGDYNAFFNNFFTNQAVGSPADIASDDGTPLPPFGPAGLPNNGVNEGDYNAFFNNFFNGCPA
ncbi:hypothetical protein BH11PLA1_BH11PLA1_23070 [soil metagenome]